MKYYITNKSEIGTNGPGQYIHKFTKAGRQRIRVYTVTGETMTEQAHAKDTDINYILKNYTRTGMIKHAKDHAGYYDDIDGQTYHEMLNTVMEARNTFMEMPSAIRNKFNNDPGQFMDFVQNPDNIDEMVEMGILVGNDGLKADGTPSGAPTETDHNGDGIPDPVPAPPT